MQSMMSEAAPSENFVQNSSILKDIFSSTTLRELFSGAAKTLKAVFKVAKVNFLLVDKELMTIFKKEEG